MERRHPHLRQPGLVTLLMDHDLVDELRLMVFPIVLNAGKRLFVDGQKVARSRAK